MSRNSFLTATSLAMLLIFSEGSHPQGVFAQESQTASTHSVPLAAPPLSSSRVTGAKSWAALKFLVGKWVGTGSDEDAAATGETVFRWEIGHQALVRRDHTRYKASLDHPAFIYEALMIIYKDSRTGLIEADYFDSGNHKIHYTMVDRTPRDTVQFQSEKDDGSPVFRLTYMHLKPADMSVTFEMSPPGSSVYHRVASGIVHRVS